MTSTNDWTLHTDFLNLLYSLKNLRLLGATHLGFQPPWCEALEVKCPDYTAPSKRQKFLEIVLPRSCTPTGRVTDVVFDSTGLKVFGEVEWKVRQHSYS
jgi:hypothetical protein